MTLARTNRKLVEELRNGLDIGATQAALDRGEITPIQARNIVKWVVDVQHIRDNPMYVVVDAAGQHIGELVTTNKGLSWIGRRYGKNYPNDSAEYPDEDQAVAFVRRDTN
ncbi:hypothetical protein [Massilia antarctica]|uniref:hypothetical protein n=1 Tax=Massilia antarctica TaxID=2765360 RepID=UPI00226DC741|nr:hypothetical protein [Massilia sp. H27-R4]MCY0914045.1 hypothetical protein [Massilia sp. H27-R4]